MDPVNNETITHFLGIRYAAAPTGKGFLSFVLGFPLVTKIRISEIQRTSLHDENKYTYVAHSKTVRRIAEDFIMDFVYLVIVNVPGKFRELFT